MNIRELKMLVANLPEDVSPAQFDLVAADVEKLAAARRKLDEDELSATLARVAELQAKLGKTSAPEPAPVRRAPEGGDYTDADMGIGEERESSGVSQSAFLNDLAQARASGAAKRRRLS